MNLLGSNSKHFIILFSCLFLVHAYGQPGYILGELCFISGNYTSDSQFQTNLNVLLPSLVSNGTRDGFFNTTVGAGSDIIYGLVQCRYDISPEDCQSCLETSSVQIIRRCPNRKKAAIRYDYCILHYSNIQFFSRPDRNARGILYSVGNVSDALANTYNQQLTSLMNTLSSTAASRVSKFDISSINYTSSDQIFGLVQCTTDLSSNDCLSCLQSMISEIRSCCDNSIGARIYSTTCNFRYETYPINPSPRQSASAPPPAVDASPPESTTGHGKGKPTNVVVIVVPIIVSVLLCAICAYFTARRVLKNKRIQKHEIIYDQDELRSEESLQFSLNVIRTATNDFSEDNELGKGGFGLVYKGELPDGQKIAVKRLAKNSGQGPQEFKNEVVLLHKLQHRNLVRLLGFCLSGEETLLIYEFVPNRSLDKYLFDPTKKAYLNWEKRYKIIGGIARGLLYLHQDSRLRIIHRDLKAGNILLDAEMNAKIADFGMAKLFGVDQTQGKTKRIAGTYGYMAPEYALQGSFSVKSDVFSFGVLLLEMISGQKINNFQLLGHASDLRSYAWKLWREGNALQLMDQSLQDSCTPDEVKRCIHIGLLCVQDNLDDRPTMSSVVLMLNSNSLTHESSIS
ncbi:hypothetical protein AQUCO_00500431v1 [Aquilegia coerulea]|uniref:Cysteine-rich receptor-like protein kinase 10 n=1 Tax=Aquilegia coerulea TaxID=218851 RepID=A0A2G5ERW7_AQUCA|nr:hypothetical protein AQUCO_00500431v1 [Aquilegia coerulea]